MLSSIKRIHQFTIIFCACLSCSYSSSARKNTISVEKKTDALVQLYKNDNAPGITVSVTQKGKIVYSSQVGYANLEYQVPITDSTVFPVASISKQFAAFAILLLEGQGKLSLDDEIKKYLPELKDLPGKVTIRQLANHTHGIPNIDELAKLAGKKPDDVLKHEEVMQLISRVKTLNFEPGAQYQYGNTSFALLAETVQRITGKTFAAFMDENVFKPLGMRHTMVNDRLETTIKNLAYSYEKTKSGYDKVLNNSAEIGASGIVTTAHDLSLWAMNFEQAIVGNENIFARMSTPSRLNSGLEIPYGLGLERKQYKGLNIVFHGGGIAGYRSYILRVPEYEFSVIVMGNDADFNPLSICYGIVDLYLAKHLQTEAPPPIPSYTNTTLRQWTGNYEFFPGVFFTLLAKNDSLYFQWYQSADSSTLPVVADKTFAFPYIPESKMLMTENGLYWFMSDFKYYCKKVSLQPPGEQSIELNSFTGRFVNRDLKIMYELMVKEGKLTATHALNKDITLMPLARDEFYTGKSFFGHLRFQRDAQGQISSFILSGQNMKNILFERL